MGRVSLKAAGLCLLVALGTLPTIAAQRAFVASYGSDANTATLCSLQAPCRSFMAAIGVVDSGGEVVALDAAGYGAVTIDKPLTLTANPGFYAGISASSGIAVDIQRSAQKVTLRGLDIRGLGASMGIRAVSVDLSVENCTLSNFSTWGVGISGGKLRVSDSVVRNAYSGILLYGNEVIGDILTTQLLSNGRAGLEISMWKPGFPHFGYAGVSMSDSVVSGNLTGVLAFSYDSSATIRFSATRAVISDNSKGVELSAQMGRWGYIGHVYATLGDSLIVGNGLGIRTYNPTYHHFESMGDTVFTANGIDIDGPVTVVPGS